MHTTNIISITFLYKTLYIVYNWGIGEQRNGDNKQYITENNNSQIGTGAEHRDTKHITIPQEWECLIEWLKSKHSGK